MGRLRVKLGCIALAVLVVFFLLLGYFQSRTLPQLCKLAQAQVQSAASAMISEAISQQIADGSLSYSKVICFEKDAQGRITALKTNMQEINRLKAAILKRINSQILSLEPSEVGVPLGNILFPELFGGTGPIIPVKVLTLRSSGADFTSHFTQAGINQTLHQLHMRVQVSGKLLILGNVLSFSASNDVMVAETVIVGEVPQTFS